MEQAAETSPCQPVVSRRRHAVSAEQCICQKLSRQACLSAPRHLLGIQICTQLCCMTAAKQPQCGKVHHPTS